MKQNYKKMIESIRVPAGLNGRVLSAAMQTEKPRIRRSPALRAAVCAALALVLIAGGVTLYPRRESTLEDNGSHTADSPVASFGLTAYAAKLGTNGGVLLESVEGKNPAELEGTVQTLSLNFADGRQTSGTYLLRTEVLGSFINEDGEALLAPILAGDPTETVSGFYAVPEESIWFLWPVKGVNTVSLSAPYGLRADGTYFHSGIDIPAQQGTDVLAAAAGTVSEAGYEASKGNYLILDHGDGMQTVYAHCLSLAVESGDSVAAGEEIAAVGATGMATGPHLHFEVRQDGAAQQPVAYFPAEVRETLKME